jgi:periplasmic copper chaperone A
LNRFEQEDMMHTALHAAFLCVALALAAPARAHATPDTSQAPVLGYVHLAVRVPHGCDGAPATAIRLQIPDGVTAVKPQRKPGWNLQVKTASEAPAVGGHETSPAVREVLWQAEL